MINKETYERLKPYYIHLRRGFKGNYIYGLLQTDFDVLYEIYKELGGRENLRYTCNSCNLRLTKFLGKLYFEYEEKMKEPEVSSVVSDETKAKKKRGRKKKEED